MTYHRKFNEMEKIAEKNKVNLELLLINYLLNGDVENALQQSKAIIAELTGKRIRNKFRLKKLELIENFGEDKFQNALTQWALGNLELRNIQSSAGLLSFWEYTEYFRVDLKPSEIATGWIENKWLSMSPLGDLYNLGYGVAFKEWPLAIINVAQDGTGGRIIMRCQWEALVQELMEKFLN